MMVSSFQGVEILAFSVFFLSSTENLHALKRIEILPNVLKPDPTIPTKFGDSILSDKPKPKLFGH